MDATKTGALISELRRERGLTQQELADQLLVSDKAVSRWETGRGLPDIENIDALSHALGVGVSELLSGERIEGCSKPEETDRIAAEGLELARRLLARRRTLAFLFGFLMSAAIAILVAVHLTAPIAIPYRDGIASVEELGDGSLAIRAAEGVAGIGINRIAETGEAFVSCHDTLLHRLFGIGSEQLASLGPANGLAAVLYYPGTPEDIVLWGQVADGSHVQTLPRLLYGSWLLIGGLACLAFVIVFVVMRIMRPGSRALAANILRAALIPLSLTLSTAAITAGRLGSIYDAEHYLTGIILLAIPIAAIAKMALVRWERRLGMGEAA